MDLILYFLLRRIFVRMELSPGGISVTRGLIFRRRAEIPLSAVTKVEIRRTMLLRFLRGKRVEISTLSGGTWFYMRAWERLPFLPQYDGACVRADTAQAVAGAFVDTRALSGAVTFALLLNRTGSVFGDDSFSRIMSLLAGAADEVTKLLAVLHIAVPRVTAFIAVFIAAAWCAVFLHKAVGMLRFRVSCKGDFITVRRGIFTLYECRLVRHNITAVTSCDTLTTLLLRRAPVYVHGTMLFPMAQRSTAHRIMSKLCGIAPPEKQIKPPFRAVFGHCAAPLGWLGVFAGLLLLTFIAKPVAADIVQSVLWSGAAVSLWFAMAYAVYMRHSFASFSGEACGIAFRRGARLYTAVIPRGKLVSRTVGRNLFQRFSGMCDLTLRAQHRLHCRLRNVGFRGISREMRSPDHHD